MDKGLGTCLFFLLDVAESPFLPGCPALGTRGEERRKQSACCVLTVCQHASGSLPVNPTQGLGAAGGPARTTCSGERSAQPTGKQKADRLMCLLSVWSRWEVHLLISPSCHSRLALLKGKRGALERLGGAQWSPPGSVSDALSHPPPPSEGGSQGRAKSDLPALLTLPCAERAFPSRIVRQPWKPAAPGYLRLQAGG